MQDQNRKSGMRNENDCPDYTIVLGKVNRWVGSYFEYVIVGYVNTRALHGLRC